MTYTRISTAAEEAGLLVMGALHPRRVYTPDDEVGTLILLGTGVAFWQVFSHAPEFTDGRPDPVDRWSKRVVGQIAMQSGASCSFPSDGPPYAPFIDWALKSGRAFSSPTGMLVHDMVGMMISYRGALHFADEFAIPDPSGTSPCANCPDRPCTTACPVGALGADAPYDTGACHNFLDTGPGQACMMQGCAARRACPISSGAGRQPDQSALHMKAFHPK